MAEAMQKCSCVDVDEREPVFGVQNITGSSCYLSAILSIVLNHKILRQMFLNVPALDDDMKRFIQTKDRVFVPRSTLNAVKAHILVPFLNFGSTRANREADRQQDAHQILVFFLDQLSRWNAYFGVACYSQTACTSCDYQGEVQGIIESCIFITPDQRVSDRYNEQTIITDSSCEKCKHRLQRREICQWEGKLFLFVCVKRPNGSAVVPLTNVEERIKDAELVGAVIRFGSGPESGHYMSVYKRPGVSCWYQIDDDVVNTITIPERDALLRRATILVYSRAEKEGGMS